jgi:hypothetical protein
MLLKREESFCVVYFMSFWEIWKNSFGKCCEKGKRLILPNMQGLNAWME